MESNGVGASPAGAGGGVPTALDSAKLAIRRGWSPIPVGFRRKAPLSSGWQHQRITLENLEAHFPAGRALNVGVILGQASGGLVDNDLDCPEAIAAARHLMPPTACIFGRPSARMAHRLYRSNLCETENRATVKLTDPTRDPKEATILELRVGGGAGAHTVVPYSVHVSGEQIAFEQGYDGEPSFADGAKLSRLAHLTAAAVLIGRHARFDDGQEAHVITFALKEAGVTRTEAVMFGLAILAIKAPEATQLKESWNKALALVYEEGKPPGIRLLELYPTPVARKLCEWLGLRWIERSATDPKPQASFSHDGEDRHAGWLQNRQLVWRATSRALERCDAWVPKLFPAAKRQKDGGYRVTSRMLGRALEEDLSISLRGIKDFGLHDQCHEDRSGKRSATTFVSSIKMLRR